MIDELVKFCLPKDLSNFINKYDSGNREESVIKQVPLTNENKTLIKKFAKLFPIRRRYRGGSRYGYTRPSSYCHKEFAERVSVYLK